jgi:hypothetical protein
MAHLLLVALAVKVYRADMDLPTSSISLSHSHSLEREGI